MMNFPDTLPTNSYEKRKLIREIYSELSVKKTKDMDFLWKALYALDWFAKRSQFRTIFPYADSIEKDPIDVVGINNLIKNLKISIKDIAPNLCAKIEKFNLYHNETIISI